MGISVCFTTNVSMYVALVMVSRGTSMWESYNRIVIYATFIGVMTVAQSVERPDLLLLDESCDAN